MMPKPRIIQVAVRIHALLLVAPSRSLTGVEVFASSGVSEFWISDSCTQVKVFDDAVSVAPGMDGRYDQAHIIPMVVKPLGQLVLTPFSVAFLPIVWIILLRL
jgi:hypothetical protein